MKAGILLNWETKDAVIFDNSVDVEVEYWFEKELYGSEAIDILHFDNLLEFQEKISYLKEQEWKLFYRTS